MSHPKKQVEIVGDIHVEVSAFKTNLYFYKSIGIEVDVRRKKKKRRWWCIGLCKTREDFKARRIRIENTYFSSIENTTIIVPSASHTAECKNESDCDLKHWAAGVGTKIKFRGGGLTPSPLDGLLTLDGVEGTVTVELPEKTLRFNVAIGKYLD